MIAELPPPMHPKRPVADGVCPGCERRGQKLSNTSEGPLCNVCNPDLPPPENE